MLKKSGKQKNLAKGPLVIRFIHGRTSYACCLGERGLGQSSS